MLSIDDSESSLAVHLLVQRARGTIAMIRVPVPSEQSRIFKERTAFLW